MAEKEPRFLLAHILDGVLVAPRHVEHALAVHRKCGAVYGDLDGARNHPENLHSVMLRYMRYERVAARVARRLFGAHRELEYSGRHALSLHKHCMDFKVGTRNCLSPDQIIRECHL